MKRILAGAVGGAAALAVIFGAGPAGADNEYKGLTFGNVQERTSGRAVIASRVGSYLPTEQCIVTGNRRASYGTGATKILVDLNCNDVVAGQHPGPSLATEAGKRAKALRDAGVKYSKDFAAQVAAGETIYCSLVPDSCRRLCERAGTCSDELTDYLGL